MRNTQRGHNLRFFGSTFFGETRKTKKKERRRPFRPLSTFFESDDVAAKKVRQKAQIMTALSINMLKRKLKFTAIVVIITSCLILKIFCEKKFLEPRWAIAKNSNYFRYSALLGLSHLGFDSFLASWVWINLLQFAQHTPLPAEKRNTLSWEYDQLSAISTLDPSFYETYRYGQAFLSVLRQDRLGAKEILLRWTQRFPNDWHTHYHYGFHIFSELHETEAAAKELVRASFLPGAPEWITSLAVRLFEKSTSLLYSLQRSLELYQLVSSPDAKTRLLFRIEAETSGLVSELWSAFNLQEKQYILNQGTRQNRTFFQLAYYKAPQTVAALKTVEDILEKPIIPNIVTLKNNEPSQNKTEKDEHLSRYSIGPISRKTL